KRVILSFLARVPNFLWGGHAVSRCVGSIKRSVDVLAVFPDEEKRMNNKGKPDTTKNEEHEGMGDFLEPLFERFFDRETQDHRGESADPCDKFEPGFLLCCPPFLEELPKIAACVGWPEVLCFCIAHAASPPGVKWITCAAARLFANRTSPRTRH